MFFAKPRSVSVILLVLLSLFLTFLIVIDAQNSNLVTSAASHAGDSDLDDNRFRQTQTLSYTVYLPLVTNLQAENTFTFISSKGGQLNSPNQENSIVFAQDAVTQTIRVAWREGGVTFSVENDKLRLIGDPFTIEIVEAETNQAVTKFMIDSVRIFVKYDDTNLNGLDENLLALFYMNEDTNEPVFLLTHVDAENNILEAPLSGWHRWQTTNSSNIRIAPMAIVPYYAMLKDTQPVIFNTHAVSSNLVVLDPDNDDTSGEGWRNLRTAEGVRDILVDCGCDVLLTRGDNTNYHTREERARLINEKRPVVALTIAYDAVSDPTASGPRRLYPTSKTEGPEDTAFGELVKTTVCQYTNLSCGTSSLGRDWVVANWVDDEIIISHVELAYLSNPNDLFVIDGFPWMFTEAVVESIATTVGKEGCLLPGCDPQRDGFSLPNQSLAGDGEETCEGYRKQYGSDSIEYELDAGVIISESVTLPVTPTLTIPAPSSTGTVVLPSEDGNVILKPIAYAYLQGLYSLLFGIPQNPSTALEAGSCEGMMVMVAKFCAGELQPEDFGADSVAGLIETELLFEAIRYYQGLQDTEKIKDASKEVPATQFIQEVMDLMDVPLGEAGNWKENMRIMRLLDQNAQCAEDKIVVGHTVLPYDYEQSGSIVTLHVFDPNYPQDRERTIEFNLDSGEWTYRNFPDAENEWSNSVVGWVALSDFPPVDTELTPHYEDDELVAANGGFNVEYGGRSARYGGRSARYGEDGCFVGCLPAGDGQLEFVNTIPEASVYQANLGYVPTPANYLYSVPASPSKADLTSALVPDAYILPKGAYTFDLTGTPDREVADFAIFGNRSLFATSGQISANTHDQVMLNDNFTEISQTTNEMSKNFSSSLYRDVGEATRVFGIGNTNVLGGEFAHFRMDEAGDSFEYINDGSSNQTYTLGLAQVGVKGISILSLPGLNIDANERQLFSACNWDSLENAFTFLHRDYGNDGTIDEVEIISNLPPFLEDGPPKITALAIDGNNYWIGTQSQGVIHYQADAKMTKVYDTGNSGLLHNVINDIRIAPDGGVWIATNQGVNLFTEGNWQVYTRTNGLASNHINAIAISPAGIAWFGTSQGLSSYDGSAWVSYTKADGLPHNNIKTLTIDANETLWLATVNNIVVRYDGATWEALEGLPNGNVDAMTAADDVVWFGMNGGLVKYEQNNFTNLSPHSVNLNEVVYDATGVLCRSGIVWVISESGKLGLYDNSSDLWLLLPQ